MAEPLICGLYIVTLAQKYHCVENLKDGLLSNGFYERF